MSQIGLLSRQSFLKGDSKATQRPRTLPVHPLRRRELPRVQADRHGVSALKALHSHLQPELLQQVHDEAQGRVGGACQEPHRRALAALVLHQGARASAPKATSCRWLYTGTRTCVDLWLKTPRQANPGALAGRVAAGAGRPPGRAVQRHADGGEDGGRIDGHHGARVPVRRGRGQRDGHQTRNRGGARRDRLQAAPGGFPAAAWDRGRYGDRVTFSAVPVRGQRVAWGRVGL
eukprot:scaffold131115_cov60-Phaeocystis_antarctica.AAC.2